MKQHCGRCRMSFRVEKPPKSSVERLKCPDCGRQFWHAATGGDPVIVGIFPADAKRIE